jgi:hypothetical protein
MPQRKQEIAGGTSGFPSARKPSTFPQMPAEARVMKTWIQQKGLIPVFLFGFCGWFLWDGLIGWPRSNERWDAHERAEKYKELKDKPAEWEALCGQRGWKVEAPPAWEKICAARGWTTEPPHKRYERSDLIPQYVCAGVSGAIGIFSLIYWLRARKMVIRSDTEAVFTPSGTRVPYGSITQIDRRKWKPKGLATVFYSLDGAKGRFVLDDAKYEPTALDTILADIQAHSAGRAKVDE